MDAWFHCENPYPSVPAEVLGGNQPRSARAQLDARRIMGFYDKAGGFGQLIVVGKTGFITHDEAVKNIALFAKEVLPRLREIRPVTVG